MGRQINILIIPSNTSGAVYLITTPLSAFKKFVVCTPFSIFPSNWRLIVGKCSKCRVGKSRFTVVTA